MKLSLLGVVPLRILRLLVVDPRPNRRSRRRMVKLLRERSDVVQELRISEVDSLSVGELWKKGGEREGKRGT